MQTTIVDTITFRGIGLHSGAAVRVRLCPAPDDHGIVFRRTDLAGDSDIAASPANWVEASLCTLLRNAAGAQVGTVEHLMAALHGCGVHNLLVEIDGPEVPVFDGSAAPFLRRILATGLAQGTAPLRVLRVLRPVTVARGDARASLHPSDSFEMAFRIAFDDPGIGTQARALRLHNGVFLRELGDCRTFCRRADVTAMQAAGLALGGTLDNAVVFDNGRVLTPGGLRRPDEPVRHKMLDAMGDLYLAGHPMLARYEGSRAGHALTGLLLRKLFADPENYHVAPCTDAQFARLPGVGISERDLPLTG